MKYNPWKRRHLIENGMIRLMQLSLLVLVICFGLILWSIFARGLPGLTLEMLTQAPKGGYYQGKDGGILNAILGSLCLAGGATLLAAVTGLPMAIFLETILGKTAYARWVRLALDVLWGVPSIVYGCFGFALMIALGLKASLVSGIWVLAILELPIFVRSVDEVVRRVPQDLERSALALGSTRLEIGLHVVTRQILPAMVTGLLLAFGRGIGDAASVLFTAGYTDNLPSSLFRPVASLPLAIFFQLNTPYPEVQARAYTAALVLTLLVLLTSLAARWLSARFSKYVIS